MALDFLRNLDADDIFISYSREDGSAYLNGLDAALSARGFSCFSDKLGTRASRLPPETLFQKIRTCKTLVLLGTGGALKAPENITPEVREFAKTNGTERIIGISFDAGASFADWSSTPWFEYLEGKNREREEPSALRTGEPSMKIVEHIVKVSDYMKKNDKVRRDNKRAAVLLSVLLFVILIAGIVAAVMGWFAADATKRAAEAIRRADDETQKANKASIDAVGAQAQAGVAKLIAEIAKADAEEKNDLAEAAAQKAEKAETRAQLEQAKANQQQTIAEFRSLANRSENLLRRSTNLSSSLSLAIDSMKKANSIHVEAVEVDTAMRANLKIFPRLEAEPVRFSGADRTSSALSPDGRHFAIIIRDTSFEETKPTMLRIYKAGTKTLAREPLRCDRCSQVAITNGLKYAAVLIDGEVSLINLSNGDRYRVNFETATNSSSLKYDDIGQIALSPRGRYLAVTFNFRKVKENRVDTKIELVDTTTWKSTRPFGEHTMWVYDISFSQNGVFAISGSFKEPSRTSSTKGVVLMDLSLSANAKQEPELTEKSFSNFAVIPQEANSCVAVGLDTNFFATDKGVWWRSSGSTTYEPIALFPAPPDGSRVAQLAFGPDGRTVVVVRSVDDHTWDHKTVQIWGANGYTDLAHVFHEQQIGHIEFDPTGQFVMTRTDSKEQPVHVFHSLDGSKAPRMPTDPVGHPGEMYVEDSYSSRAITLGNSIATVWDRWTGKSQVVTLQHPLAEIQDAALGAGGNFLALAGPDKQSGEQTIIVYRLVGTEFRKWKRLPRNLMPAQEFAGTTPAWLRISSDGRFVVARYEYDQYYGKQRAWDLVKELNVTPNYLGPDITVSANGRFLISGDGLAELFDLYTHKQVELMPGDSVVRAIAFSRDSRYVAVGTDEGIVHIFNTSNPEQEIARLEHLGTITTISFSPDSRYIATASSDFHTWYRSEKESYPLRIWLLKSNDLIEEASARLKLYQRLEQQN